MTLGITTLAIDYGGTLATGPAGDPEGDRPVDPDAVRALNRLHEVGYRTGGRAFGTSIHEHACIRCPLLHPDPGQRHAWSRYAATSSTASPKHDTKAGPVKSKVCRSASQDRGQTRANRPAGCR